jgi:hypothetical protein
MKVNNMCTIANFILTTWSTLVHIKVIKTGPNRTTWHLFVDNMYTIAIFVVWPVELRTRPMYNINWAGNCKIKPPMKKLKENQRNKDGSINVYFIFISFYGLDLCRHSFLFILFYFFLNTFLFYEKN